jgi:membrane associated rhomboid family serine protease
MPFIPISDDNPLRLIRFQVVTVSLIVINAVIFLIQQMMDDQQLWEFWLGYGLIPAVLTGDAQLTPDLVVLPAWLTLFTSAFLHNGYWHLGGNMLFLWVFGDNVEDATGHWRFLVFYFLCAAAAGLAQTAVDPDSQIPMVGASGAVAGVLGAYMMLHPRRRMLILLMRTIPLRLHVGLVLVIWIAFQVGAGVWFSSKGESDTAWWAHVGGFAAGMILILFLRSRGVALFDRDSVRESET